MAANKVTAVHETSFFKLRLEPPRGNGRLFSLQCAEVRLYSTSSGHGTMVDFTVFIAIASATARPMPSSVNG